MNAAAEVIYDLVDPTANLIFGAVIDPSLSGQVSYMFQRSSFSSLHSAPPLPKTQPFLSLLTLQ